MNFRFIRRLSLTALLLALLTTTTSPALAADKKSGTSIDWSNATGTAHIDPKYTPDALTKTFQALCKKLRYRVREMSIDQTEFPFLIHGTFEGHADYKAIRDALSSFSGYAYAGSMTAVVGDGSATHFVLNMIPSTAYPRDQARELQQRAIDRMRALMPRRSRTR